MARRFAVVSIDTGRKRYFRYEIAEDRFREATQEGHVGELILRTGGDLEAALAALLADWRPEGGPAGFPPRPRPGGTPARMREAA